MTLQTHHSQQTGNKKHQLHHQPPHFAVCGFSRTLPVFAECLKCSKTDILNSFDCQLYSLNIDIFEVVNLMRIIVEALSCDHMCPRQQIMTMTAVTLVTVRQQTTMISMIRTHVCRWLSLYCFSSCLPIVSIVCAIIISTFDLQTVSN